MSRPRSDPNHERVSQLSFVQSDSDDPETRRPILPSTFVKKKSAKRKKAGVLIPGLAIQSISTVDEESQPTPSRAPVHKGRDSTPASSSKRKPAKKSAQRASHRTFPNKSTLPPSKKKQTPIQSAGMHLSNENESPCRAESCIPTREEMEVPYAQNLGIKGDENLLMLCALSSDQKEPLNPGDVIFYYHPAFVSGSELSIRVTQVVATDPSQTVFPLTLDNGELIPRDTRMRRLKEYDNGKLYNHPGIFRDLENFRMKKRALSAAERKMLPGAREKTIELLHDIMTKTNEKLNKLPSEMMKMNATGPVKQNDLIEINDSDSSSDSDSSDESLPGKETPPTISMATRFSIETQQNRKHLSPPKEFHKEKNPKSLVLKNVRCFKAESQAITSSQKLNAKKVVNSSARKRKDYEEESSVNKDPSSDSVRSLKQNTSSSTSSHKVTAKEVGNSFARKRKKSEDESSVDKDSSPDIARVFKHNTSSSHKLKAKEVGNSFARKREQCEEESSDDKDSSPDSARAFKKNTASTSTVKESKRRAYSGSSTLLLSKRGVPTDERQRGTKEQHSRKNDVDELASLESDDDFDDELLRPVFSNAGNKHNVGLRDKSTDLAGADTTKFATKPNIAAKKSERERFHTHTGKRKPLSESRWSIDSVNKNAESLDCLWDSSDGDDSIHISPAKMRRITKSNNSQSSSFSQNQGNNVIKRRKIKSTFLPSELEKSETSFTPNTEDTALEKDVWDDYKPRFLNKQKLERQNQDEDIDGFSSQETSGNKSNTWGLRHKRRSPTLISSSTLKLQPTPFSLRRNRL